MFRATRRELSSARSAVFRAIERVRYGYDILAVWNTDEWLCKHLGEILVRASQPENLHGYPYRYDDDPSLWGVEMHVAGKALLRHHRSQHDFDTSDDHDRIYLDAQNAMRWVADNLGSLWD